MNRYHEGQRVKELIGPEATRVVKRTTIKRVFQNGHVLTDGGNRYDDLGMGYPRHKRPEDYRSIIPLVE